MSNIPDDSQTDRLDFNLVKRNEFTTTGEDSGATAAPDLASFHAPPVSRRDFLRRTSTFAALGAGASALGINRALAAPENIPGFDKASTETTSPQSSVWTPVSDRKIRVGIAGYGLCQFGAAFGFQDHPNVEIIAVTDLVPERCDGLAKACRCSKTYPSLEEMIKDDKIEAVFVATDAPSHARQCIAALKHGKHVASAVPAVYGDSLEEADELLESVKSTGLKYMMFETSCYHADLFAMQKLYKAGILGKLVYSEGEYYHYMPEPLGSYKEWRVGLPPQWYPTHSNAYYIGVTGGSFTEVSCMGMPSIVEHCKPGNNVYKNPFGTEIAMFRTSEGGVSRMAVSWDTPGMSGEMGRIRGQKGSFYGKFEGEEKNLPDTSRPPLPQSVQGGHHGGSHGPLMHEFITSILENRTPAIDVAMSLNMSVSGIIAHKSAMKDGELLKIPQYSLS